MNCGQALVPLGPGLLDFEFTRVFNRHLRPNTTLGLVRVVAGCSSSSWQVWPTGQASSAKGRCTCNAQAANRAHEGPLVVSSGMQPVWSIRAIGCSLQASASRGYAHCGATSGSPRDRLLPMSVAPVSPKCCVSADFDRTGDSASPQVIPST